MKTLSDMHLDFSIFNTFQKFKLLAFYCGEKLGADILLSSEKSGQKSYICVNSIEEYILNFNNKFDLSHFKKFVFKDEKYTLGFVSYDCGVDLRGIKSSKDKIAPKLHFKKYETIIIFDHTLKSVKVIGKDNCCEHLTIRDLELFYDQNDQSLLSVNYKPCLTKNEYENRVEKTLSEIRSGNTYQLNMTMKFESSKCDLNPVKWFFKLYDEYPASYYAFFNSSNLAVVSSSPELFLKVEDGNVLSEPIKGTLKFDDFSEELVSELQNSPKEDSELSMIVDLIRNDISSCCEVGSVKVKDHKSVFVVDNLLQMFSRVHGKLKSGKDCLDLFFDCFPGGSITGCPKKSSMEIIERLEPHSRDLYCGSIVLIENERSLISSILIRTAMYDYLSKCISYYAGSGIVIDSEPEKEFYETLAKADKFLNNY